MTKILEKIAQKIEKTPEVLESEHVHSVYNQIAGHFSQTRYKPWPVIDDFLTSKPLGSLIADVGCGNGKYMCINKDNLMYIGADRSDKLVEIASALRPGAECLVGDALRVPFRSQTFDHAISIAVIHHMSTIERRIKAVEELLRIVKPGGEILIFVWAQEQSETSRYQFKDQDVFVPWNLSSAPKTGTTFKMFKGIDQSHSQSIDHCNEDENITKKETVFQRFYHVFKKGELVELARKAADESNTVIEITKEGYDKDNWFVVVKIIGKR